MWSNTCFYFIKSTNTKIINQFHLTYTLRSGLNRLQMYLTEIKEKQIFGRIKMANMSTFWVRFLQIRSACGWMSDRCCGHFGSQRGSFQRNRHGSAICKKRSQKCGVATWFFQIFVFLLFLSHTPEVYSNHNTVYMLYGIGIYNKHCLPLQKLKNNNI